MLVRFSSWRARYLALTAFLWGVLLFAALRGSFPDGGGGPGAPVLTSLLAALGRSASSFFSSSSGRRGPNGELYPPPYRNKLPVGSRRDALPRVQHEFGRESAAEASERLARREAVRARLVRSWKSYQEAAFGMDELRPLSGGDAVGEGLGGWGATAFDSLDTLWLAGCRWEFEAAVEALAGRVSFNATRDGGFAAVNVFETAIRYLGGLLGAHDVSGGRYPQLLRKAVELGDWIYAGAFDTPNRMPVTRWRPGVPGQTADRWAVLAEVGSFGLEFARLSQLTGDTKYYDAAYRVGRALEAGQLRTKIPGLWPTTVDARDLRFDRHATFSLGGMADSAYEYLPKMTAMTNGVGGGDEPMFRRMYERAIEAAKRHLFFRPMLPDPEADVLIAGAAEVRLRTVARHYQGQHLACFAGGMVLLAARLYGRGDSELDVGRRLTDGCVWAYASMPSGIMPEAFHMAACPATEWLYAAPAPASAPGGDGGGGGGGNRDGGGNGNHTDDAVDAARKRRAEACPWDDLAWTQAIASQQGINELTRKMHEDSFIASVVARQKLVPGYVSYEDVKYALRPEAIESVFYAYRITGDRKYLDDAWRMWQAVDAHTRTRLAHAELKDVTVARPRRRDRMESFWIAETLKYFYLIFSEPEYLSLDRNTEAHPFLRPGAVWQEDVEPSLPIVLSDG